MKRTNDEIDQMIKEALSREEAAFFDELGEQSLPEMVGGLFSGKMKWLNILMMVCQVVLFGVAVYCAEYFFQADEVKEMLRWGAISLFFVLATSFLKLFQWMQLDKNAIMREVKRMELQVASLSAKLDKQKVT